MTAYEFAVDTVSRLQQAGFQALLAGGCVRDHLLGKPPKDFDVATNARPEAVRELFGRSQTLAIGASFGVISRIGPKSAGQIDVATFRRDGGYSDGRHPDSVEFADARADAQRRDFTINGLFLDPLTNQVFDFVEGKADLEERVIRAIGDPYLRFSEDKLRLLRAVRFAAALGFEIEPETLAAIRKLAPQLHVVSAERIGAEMRRILVHPTRHRAAELLVETGLLKEVAQGAERELENRANWRSRVKWLEKLGVEARFETAATLLLMQTLKLEGAGPLADQWKLSTAERRSLDWIQEHWLTLTRAGHTAWSQIQPLLIQPDACAALHLAETLLGKHHVGVEFCRQRLAWPNDRLNPPALVTGTDLMAIGLKAGPGFSRILRQIRQEQLDGLLNNRAQALQRAAQLLDVHDAP